MDRSDGDGDGGAELDWGLFPLDPQLKSMLWEKSATLRGSTDEDRAARHVRFPSPMAPYTPGGDLMGPPPLHKAQGVGIQDIADGRISVLLVGQAECSGGGHEHTWTQVYE